MTHPNQQLKSSMESTFSMQNHGHHLVAKQLYTNADNSSNQEIHEELIDVTACMSWISSKNHGKFKHFDNQTKFATKLQGSGLIEANKNSTIYSHKTIWLASSMQSHCRCSQQLAPWITCIRGDLDYNFLWYSSHHILACKHWDQLVPFDVVLLLKVGGKWGSKFWNKNQLAIIFKVRGREWCGEVENSFK